MRPVETGDGEDRRALRRNVSGITTVDPAGDALRDSMSTRVYEGTLDAVSRMVAAAAHDLRSPLASMTFTVGVLRRRWRELPESEVDEMLVRIANACEWQQRAIAAFVESARAAAPQDVPLKDLLFRVAELLRPLFREGSNRLIIHLQRDLVVRGTPLSLEHIFTNLVTNAAAASDSPVEVRIEDEIVTDDQATPTVCVVVRDDGPGIAPEVREQIFEPFFSTKLHGAGMGLCLAREAARHIGGDLKLRDDEGPGATFEIRLPLGTPPATDEEPES